MNLQNSVLIDSSVWIEYFRAGTGYTFDIIDNLLDLDHVVLCGIVEMELLQGVRKKEANIIRDLFSVIPYVEIIRDDFINAGNLLNQLKSKGITIPPTDCLISVICIRKNYRILTFDKHFDYIKNIKKFEI